MYRYSKDKHNQSLLTMGSVRVGTLHDFRNSEHKRGIVDPQEGKKKISHYIDHLQTDGSYDQDVNDSIHSRALNELVGTKVYKNVTFNNILISRSYEYPNCFVFCTSKFKSQDTMKEFEGANSCIQITDPTTFYCLLTDTINSIIPVIFCGVHNVTYQNRSEKWNGRDVGDNPALIKEPEFEKQGEIRAIWQPRNKQKIEPLFVANYKLTSHCKYVLL